MVTVTDDNVFNVLVDQTQMESILLIGSDNLARNLMAQSVGIISFKNVCMELSVDCAILC